MSLIGPALANLERHVGTFSVEVFSDQLDPRWVGEALEKTGTESRRLRKLPADLVVRLAIAAALFRSLSIRTDWAAAFQALGGHPNLVTDGEVDVWPAGTSTFYTTQHPRAAIGVTKDGHLLLVTVDGRTSAGAGMTIAALAQYMKDLGAWNAFNLDGGGSTTLFVSDMSINGIVNFPSDNQKADHWGERAVSDGLFVYSQN